MVERSEDSVVSARHKRAMHSRLMKWFDSRERDLPWLKKRNPYRIWVSEIMLQQTQIATVIDYYARFIKAFPTVRKLAAASEDEVLRLWEGLGYYRRARQLHKAAKKVVTDHNGKFPQQFEDVLALPGIGRYTASAILSISLDQKLPILEANTIRLFARLMAMKIDTTTSAAQKDLWSYSEGLLPNERVGDFNQALMDFGRHICKPTPVCRDCPIQKFCQAYDDGTQNEIPVNKKKMKYVDLNEAIVLIKRRKNVLLRKCQPGERWAGLWDFPRFDLQLNSPTKSLASDIESTTGLATEVEPLNETIKHAVTRFRIKLECFRATEVKGRLFSDSGYQWKSRQELNELPLSKTGRKFADQFA